MLFFVPCTIKRDLKQHFAQEIFQKSQQTHAKTISSETCSIQQTNLNLEKHVESQKHDLTSSKVSFSFIPKSHLFTENIFRDEFTHHKEKIPTHIRLQLYLI